MPPETTLQIQCAAVGWPLRVEFATPGLRAQGWLSASGDLVGPELLILERFSEQGQRGCWCEGGSINLLMKAASLEVLARRNTFHDRTDAIRRYFEAQCTILKPHEAEVIASIAAADLGTVSNAVMEICSDDFIRAAYPRVTPSFLTTLWEELGATGLTAIARKFFENPYDYRAGWPDLTMIDQRGVHFVEVKTTDRLHPSQLRFAGELASPLGLRCQVVQVKPVGSHSAV